MQELEQAVVRHYGSADLNARIFKALEAAGADPEHLTLADLAPVDEFHVGGRVATVHALAKLPLSPSDHVLDVGSGVGGAARYAAQTFGCRVTGIDLTPEFVEAATDLTRRTGLADKVDFRTASALAMPFGDAAFDAAYSLHVAMNIRDRQGLYREIARVLKPDGAFLAYDVMRGEGEGLAYPMPWAATSETSYLVSPAEMRDLLDAAGLDVVEEEDRRAFGIDFFRQRLAAGPPGPSQVGVHLLIGPELRLRMENLLGAMEAGAAVPVVMVARRR